MLPGVSTWRGMHTVEVPGWRHTQCARRGVGCASASAWCASCAFGVRQEFSLWHGMAVFKRWELRHSIFPEHKGGAHGPLRLHRTAHTPTGTWDPSHHADHTLKTLSTNTHDTASVCSTELPHRMQIVHRRICSRSRHARRPPSRHTLSSCHGTPRGRRASPQGSQRRSRSDSTRTSELEGGDREGEEGEPAGEQE